LVLTRLFTSRVTRAPNMAALSKSWMRSALPVSINWVCSPRRTRMQSSLYVRRPRIEDRTFCCTVRLLISKCRDGSHPARFHGLGSCSIPGPQETRYGDGCWRRKGRSALVAQCCTVDRHSARADHYFHGHHPAHAKGPGHPCSSALAEPAAERRARE